MKKQLKIPKFKNEDEERNFWAKADTSRYFDWSKAERGIFPNLKPTSSATWEKIHQERDVGRSGGILQTKGKLSKMLLKERSKDKERGK